MKILHVIPSISQTRGGPSAAVRHMAEGIAALGHEAHIATTDDDGASRLSVPLGEGQLQDSVTYWYFARSSRLYLTSVGLFVWLLRHSADYDVIHIHSLFTFSTLAAALAARRSRTPYIVRPYGTLNRWGLMNRRRRVKQLSLKLIELPLLRGAASIHFTSIEEENEAMEVGILRSATVIPLGIPVERLKATAQDKEAFFAHHIDIPPNRPLILFLSRLHPKKGLDLLIPAFAEVLKSYPESYLLLAGSGDDAYEATLRDLISHLGVADQVRWLGFVTGTEKLEALAAATCFVMPSYSENFGIAAVEALAAGLPTIISDQVPIHETVTQYGAGWVVPCTIEAIRDALLDCLARPDDLPAMADAAVEAAQSYSVKTMASRLEALYLAVSSSRPLCARDNRYVARGRN